MFQDFYSFKLIDVKDSGMTWNDTLEIVFVLKGDGTLLLDGSQGHYDIAESDIFVVNGYQPRDINLRQGGLAIALYVDYAFVTASSPEIANPYFDCKSFLYVKKAQEKFDELRQSFAHSFKTYYKKESNLSVVMRGKIMGIMSILFSSFHEEDNNTNLKSLERIRHCINYIHGNFQENISLNDLSDYTNLSSAYLSRIFKSSLGINITDYIAQVRMNHAIKLMTSDKTITQISYESGFTTPNAMIAVFNKYKAMTPGQYRQKLKDLRLEKPAEFSSHLNDEGFSTAFETLLDYLPKEKTVNFKSTVKETSVNYNDRKGLVSNSWRNVLNVGYAANLLDDQLKRQVEVVQNKFNFKYIRIKGIFDDLMFVHSTGINNQEITSYVYVDKVIDFILTTGAKPMIEVGHMPSMYSSEKKFRIRSTSHISSPSCQKTWKRIVEDLMKHFKARYGEENLKHWIVSPWLSPEFYLFDAFELEDYEKTYVKSYQAIREISPHIIIAGPGISINNLDLINWFLEMSLRNELELDYLSFKSYGTLNENHPSESMELRLTPDTFPFAISDDENHLRTCKKELLEVLEKYKIDKKQLLIEEWNSNIWQRDYCNDTIYKSAYIFKTILENMQEFSAIAYYSLSDRLDEIAPVNEEFSGGFGLFTKNNIPKSAYYSLCLLNSMGKHIVDQGEGYLITKDKNSLQIYIYNYTHFDLLYRYRHLSGMSETQRYGSFNHKDPISFHFQVVHLPKETLIMNKYKISKNEGSAFDTWVKMGAPRRMDEFDLRYLKEKSLPSYETIILESEEVINIRANLEPHEVALIEIKAI